MNDTSPEMAQKMREMLKEKSPEQRLIMGCNMTATSKYLVSEAIKRSNPGISLAGLRQELFIKFYGNEFSPMEKVRILNHLEKTTKKA